MHIHPTKEAGKAFFQHYHDKGEIVMLNLLKFREIADYTGNEDLKPKEEISGKKAYDLYMKYTAPILMKAGGKVLFFGRSDAFLIGPEQEKWDLVLLVRHASAEKFMAFAQNPEYLKTAGHRTAALADSRLLPIKEVKQK